MKKKIVKKIIGSAIIFIFAMFFLQVILPLQVSAESLNWENPNSSGDNPYQFKVDDVLNSEMIMQVVGCTGVVDKVTSKITDFAQEKITSFLTKKLKAAAKVLLVKVGKVLGITGVASVPGTVSGNLTDIPKEIPTGEIQNTSDTDLLNEAKKTADNEEAKKKREECLNGIAVTLARNQLTSMTRYTMNWVNTGFGGDPMYVQNITSFTNKLEKNVLETGINILTNSGKAYPYGADFSRSAINGYNSGSSFRSGASNFLDSLTSDLSNFITDPRSYYSENALEKANTSNNAFANDFSTGGWDGWLALTQKDQNNPLGFTMRASEFLQDQEMTQTESVKEELATNNGFLSQKKCVKWELYYDDGEDIGKPIFDDSGNIKTSTSKQSDYDKCASDGYEVVTPGSLIKDKVVTYINSAERQLELVQTINDSLNSLFSSLISKLLGEGLSSLSSEQYAYTDPNIGIGSDYNTGSTDSAGGNSGARFSSGYANGSFDLTHDLGNTFIHNYTTNSRLGNWNATENKTTDNNNPQLKIGIKPVNSQGYPLVNVYYYVYTAGKTILINNGYNDWEIGDRAFWDGSSWQNWKRGTTNPIKKRGVLQIQKDYIVAAKELLMNLPNIMPKIGELDYCIPGPNPNWSTNSLEAEAAFTKLAGTMESKPIEEWYCKNGFLRAPNFRSDRHVNNSCYLPITMMFQDNRSRTTGHSFNTAGPGTEEYDNYFNIFKDTLKSLWSNILDSNYWSFFNDKYPNGTVTAIAPLDESKTLISEAIKKVSVDMKTFHDSYGGYINNLYGSRGLMQKKFLEKENSTDLTINDAYLPMAAEGLSITKDIVSYDETINTTMSDYRDSIIQANANIDKLALIKNSVSKIIKAAQDRRDAELMKELGLTYDQYINKYKNCLDEENIVYYDDMDIIGDMGIGERCNDGIDNDLDGLIDMKDPDCTPHIESCNNGIDDDLDGWIDASDPDCNSNININTNTNLNGLIDRTNPNYNLGGTTTGQVLPQRTQ